MKRGAWRALGGRLDPVAMLLGPVFQREVRVMGRRAGTYWMRGLAALGLAGVGAIALASAWDAVAAASPVATLQGLQQIAPILSVVVGWFQLIALGLAAPLLTGASICDERRKGTLAALMTTPLTAAQIVLGKLASRLVQVVILGLLAVPLLLGIRIFGGLEPEAVLAFTALSMSVAFLGGSLGVLLSIRARRGVSAAGAAAAVVVALNTGPLLLVVLLSATSGTAPPAWIFLTSAPMAAGLVSVWVLEGSIAFLGQWTITHVWGASAAWNAGLGVLACAWSVAALRRAMRREAEGAAPPAGRVRAAGAARRSTGAGAERSAEPPASGVGPADASEADTPARDGAAGAAPARRRRARPGASERVVSDRPVLWRELRQRTFRQPWMAWVAVLASAGLLLFLYAEVGLHTQELHAVISVIGVILALAVALSGAGAAVAGEREDRTWDVLLTTALTPRQILSGKFLGALRRLWVVPAILGAHLAASVAAGFLHPIALVHAAAILAGPLLMLTGTGVLFSLICRRPQVASVLNLLLALGLWVGLPVGVLVLGEGFDWFRVDWFEDLAAGAFLINPVPMLAVAVVEAHTDGAYAWSWSSLSYDTPEATFGATGMTALTLLVGALYAGAGVLAVHLGCRWFLRFSGRTS